MAERMVLGVDFSGAENEGKTWISEGRLTSQEYLIIDHVYPILRNDLAKLLEKAPLGTVVAFDFPFGLPKVFLESLNINANTMRDVWPQIAEMSIGEYRRNCLNFGTHPKRTGDKRYSVSISALNTRLVPMTYHGIKMLHTLNEQHPNLWCIPPLDSDDLSNNRITFLEVMPGAFLWSIGFDRATVKGYKQAANSLVAREEIINNLADYAGLGIPNLPNFRLSFRANDDCLDAVIASVVAALWVKDQSRFCHPGDAPEPDVIKDAQLEGWIYALNK